MVGLGAGPPVLGGLERGGGAPPEMIVYGFTHGPSTPRGRGGEVRDWPEEAVRLRNATRSAVLLARGRPEVGGLHLGGVT